MKKLKFFFLIILVILLPYQSINYFCNDIKQNNTIKITISIDCSTILSNYSRLDTALQKEKYVPADGIILTETELYINEGDTVLDALKIVTKNNGIQLEYSQSPKDVYVEGINHIYEFSCGDLSGWMYKVNGNFASKGCSSYILKENDCVQWVYTCNLGKDVGESFNEIQ